jgi:hypothetical protein
MLVRREPAGGTGEALERRTALTGRRVPMPASVTLERFTCDFGTAAMLTGAATRKRTVGEEERGKRKGL